VVLVAPPVGLAEAQAASLSTGPSFDLLADESVTDMQVSRVPLRVPVEYPSSTVLVPFEYPSSTRRVPFGCLSSAARLLTLRVRFSSASGIRP
jgi:hypothetical protein